MSGRLALGGKTGVKALAQHESTLERDCIVLLDWDWRVRRISPQPFVVHYALDGHARRYTPDIQADFDDGHMSWSEVYEVKYRDDLREHWAEFRPRFKAALAWCRQREMRFRLLTEREIRTPVLQNVRFLRRYRNMPRNPVREEQLAHSVSALGLSSVRTLLEAAWPNEQERAAGASELWRLVACGVLAIDISQPLSMDSTVRAPQERPAQAGRP